MLPSGGRDGLSINTFSPLRPVATNPWPQQKRVYTVIMAHANTVMSVLFLEKRQMLSLRRVNVSPQLSVSTPKI